MEQNAICNAERQNPRGGSALLERLAGNTSQGCLRLLHPANVALQTESTRSAMLYAHPLTDSSKCIWLTVLVLCCTIRVVELQSQEMFKAFYEFAMPTFAQSSAFDPPFVGGLGQAGSVEVQPDGTPVGAVGGGGPPGIALVAADDSPRKTEGAGGRRLAGEPSLNSQDAGTWMSAPVPVPAGSNQDASLRVNGSQNMLQYQPETAFGSSGMLRHVAPGSVSGGVNGQFSSPSPPPSSPAAVSELPPYGGVSAVPPLRSTTTQEALLILTRPRPSLTAMAAAAASLTRAAPEGRWNSRNKGPPRPPLRVGDGKMKVIHFLGMTAEKQRVLLSSRKSPPLWPLMTHCRLERLMRTLLITRGPELLRATRERRCRELARVTAGGQGSIQMQESAAISYSGMNAPSSSSSSQSSSDTPLRQPHTGPHVGETCCPGRSSGDPHESGRVADDEDMDLTVQPACD
ncbi:hypothetical protein BESB_023140 [Besnoitia besnoiti]|uniref:Uncharacterized protein n=1 Tax=Besnoitia besnoiti TaxID=94643 RepID=A0A2A9M8V3_BESBE|nr:hypothetical protein BESB_023140 [Besnoitia besnoiti]PFH31822.1 hypothetical protein BESB_023140 [Besnoitia besnoiti]